MKKYFKFKASTWVAAGIVFLIFETLLIGLSNKRDGETEKLLASGWQRSDSPCEKLGKRGFYEGQREDKAQNFYWTGSEALVPSGTDDLFQLTDCHPVPSPSQVEEI